MEKTAPIVSCVYTMLTYFYTLNICINNLVKKNLKQTNKQRNFNFFLVKQNPILYYITIVCPAFYFHAWIMVYIF